MLIFYIIKNEKWGILSKGLTAKDFIEAIDRARILKIDKTKLISLYKSRYAMEKCAKEYVKLYIR